MTELLKIFVRGNPQPMPRPRGMLMGRGKGARVHMYTATTYPKDHAKAGQTLPWLVWKEAVLKTLASQHKPLKVEGPLRLDVDFYFERPEYLLKKNSPVGRIFHAVRPDGFDNCMKIIADAMTEFGVMKDDGQICQGECQKWWVKRGDPAGAWIILQSLGDALPAPVLFEDDEPATIGFPVKDLGKLFEPRPAGRPKTVVTQPEQEYRRQNGFPVVSEPHLTKVLTDWNNEPIRATEEKEVPQRPRPPGWVEPVPMVVPALD